MWFACKDRVSYRMHQMGFAQSHTTINKQRVIGCPGVFADLLCCSLGELVAFADDESFESGIGIQPTAHDLDGGSASRTNGFAQSPGFLSRVGRRALGQFADEDADGWCGVTKFRAQPIFDALQSVGADPIDDESVGCQQTQFGSGLERLQRPHPGVELGVGQISSKRLCASIPKRRVHATAGLPVWSGVVGFNEGDAENIPAR